MILELRNKTPFIHFGFSRVEKQGFTNEVINVYVNTLYNENEYSFDLVAIGASIIKVSDYQYQLTYTTIGSKTIDLTVSNKSKTITLGSNTLNIEVQPITIDNTKITVDNNIVTIDSN